MKPVKKVLLFGCGGAAYVGLEFLYRGYSHGSMFLAGGACFLLIGHLGRQTMAFRRKLLWGAGTVTAVELLTGLLVNRDYSVWDYRGRPGNFLGQICPEFSLLWLPVTALALLLYPWAEKALERLPGVKNL